MDNHTAENRAILNALRTVLNLPEHITSLDLSLRMDELPRVTCSMFPTYVQKRPVPRPQPAGCTR